MTETPRPPVGNLALSGYSGNTRQRVEIIDETPKRWRIRAITRTRLAGRLRWLEPGQTALVPKHAVRDNCVQCHGAKGGVPGNENLVNGRTLCDYCSEEQVPR